MTIVVANTKGGVAKTTIALNVLPLLVKKNNPNASITYYQLDDNNKIIANSPNIEIKEYKLDETTNAIDGIELDAMLDENKVNIIDCGGGNDTKAVIENLANSNIENLIFVIPATQMLSTRHNIEETIKLIKQKFKKPTIYLVLSMVYDFKNIEKDFISIYGDEDFGIKPIDLKDIKGVGAVPYLTFLQILELDRQILLDKYNEVSELLKDEQKYIKEYAATLKKQVEAGEIDNEAAKKEYSKFKDKIRAAKRIKEDTEKIIEANKDIIGALWAPINKDKKWIEIQ